MKITKFVDVEAEVEVNIDIEDIAQAVVDNREKVKPAMFSAINSFFNFMEQMPDEVVDECTEKQIELITDFFDKQLARFKAVNTK